MPLGIRIRPTHKGETYNQVWTLHVELAKYITNKLMRSQLEVAFDTEKIRDLCLNSTIADAEMGAARSATLKALVADLRAARTLSDLPLAPLLGSTGEYKISHGSSVSVVFVNNHVRGRDASKSTSNSSHVKRIRIVRIITYD